MPDGVDARVHAVQPAGGDAMAHRAGAQPELDQLPQRDHAVLRAASSAISRSSGRQWFETAA